MMRLCVANGGFLKPSETMIVNHINNLYGGATCVIYQNDFEPGPCPSFRVPADAHKRGNAVRRALTKAKNVYRYGTMKVPASRTRRAAVAFLAEHQIDVGLSEIGTIAPIVAPIFEAAEIPLFTMFRGADASKELRLPRRVRTYKLLMPRLAGVISVSQFLLDNLQAAGIAHPNAIVLPSGADTRKFVPLPKHARHCVAVGRFIDKKMPLLTLRAFANAARQHPEARLEMIGDGPLFEDAQRFVAKSGMADRIILHGRQPHAFVRDAMGRAEVFLQHSVTAPNGDTEGLPTAIQEAMACGAVVVSTRHAGIPEAVEENVTGFIVDEHDEAGFTAAVARALSDDTDRTTMGQIARARAEERYDSVKLMRRLEAFVDRTLEERKDARAQAVRDPQRA